MKLKIIKNKKAMPAGSLRPGFSEASRQGFTLIELVVASSILAVIMGGLTIFGVQVMRTYGRSQALKNTVENAGYAIESLNKAIRTSHYIDGGGDEIFIIDNITGNSFCYRFNGDVLAEKMGNASATSCSDIGASFSDIVSDPDIEVTGSFSIKETDRDNSERGFVRTNIVLTYEADEREGFEEDEIIFQSSVSLRDYGYSPTP